jgi:hypothetical protein
MAPRIQTIATALATAFFVASPAHAPFADDETPYVIHIDTDAPGFDYKRLDPPTLDACQSRCAADAACKTFTYDRAKEVCFLKYSGSVKLIPRSGAITGRKTADQKFSIAKYKDAPGYDYDRLDPLSASDCRRRCSAEAQCQAFSYNVSKRVCFLKTTADIPLIRYNDAITGLKASAVRLLDEEEAASGTGFAVTTDGLILTNQHVVQGCRTVTAEGWGAGVIEAEDSANDLALVKFEFPSSPVTFRLKPAEIGEDVFAVGFPYAGELGLHFTKGSVSSNIGPENDASLLQFTAPVQQGNSGGPLLDESGLVIGVVRAILVPGQNVNFAIHAGLVRDFLEKNGVNAITAASPSEPASPSEIAKRAKLHTVRLSCVNGAGAAEAE